MIKENVNNLTNLWESVSKAQDALFQNELFKYSFLSNSDWPNRLWFNNDITEEGISQVKEFILSSRKPLKIPCFDNSELCNRLTKNGFTFKSEQIGMSLQLSSKIVQETQLEIRLVKSEKDAILWEEIYPISFGYTISSQSLISSWDKVNYYLALYDGKPIGTSILYTQDKISGIHGMGIIPEMRRKGFAEEIMIFILNESIKLGSESATLQASNMGKGLYSKLGFMEDFMIKTFLLENNS